MSVYAISDLHLPLGIDKPMNVFGHLWENYVDRIHDNWMSLIKEDDTVLLCGDFSWATYLEQSIADFEFLHALPGKKVLSKGNHDYWWTTAAKLEKFKEERKYDDITFLHNNSVLVEGAAVCCARGWKSPFDKDFGGEDEKIYERELLRLRLSLESGKKLSDDIIVMLHFPPDYAVMEVIEEFGAKMCIYGHLHTNSGFEKRLDKENYFLVSADFLAFEPKKLI